MELADDKKVEETGSEAGKESAKVASIGSPQRVNANLNNITPTDEPNGKNDEGGDNAKIDANQGAAASTAAAPTPPADDQPAITDEQIAKYFKDHGIEYDSIDKFKEKQAAATPAAQTAEQIEAAERQMEKRRVDIFVSGGGTLDQYIALKNIANADLSVLSLNTLKAELKEAGFDSDEADQIIAERYYEISEDDLEQFTNETDKAYAKRKKDYGAKRLENYALNTKTQAAGIFADLNKAIESEDLSVQEEQQLSANIDDQFKSLPRKSTFEIGEVNGKPVSPVDYEVSDADYAEIQDLLKDPQKRNNFLLTPDGKLNIPNIFSILAKNKALESAAKAAYHEGGSRQVAIFEKTFPSRSAYELGVGGASKGLNNGSKKPTSFGKPQRVAQT